jgi:putative FmdB family regulatory protein
MPLYEYQCARCGERFERLQKMGDPPLVVHDACGGELRKLFSSPAFHLKGSGWYVTDYARAGKGGEKGGDRGSEKGSDRGEDRGGSAAESGKQSAAGEGKKADSGTSGSEKPAPSTSASAAGTKSGTD